MAEQVTFKLWEEREAAPQEIFLSLRRWLTEDGGIALVALDRQGKELGVIAVVTEAGKLSLMCDSEGIPGITTDSLSRILVA